MTAAAGAVEPLFAYFAVRPFIGDAGVMQAGPEGAGWEAG